MNLKNCQVFTPPETVNYMLDLLDYHHDIFGKTIIDNSCGIGNFLVEIVRRFIIDANSKNIGKRKIKNALEKCIVGCDLDLECVNKCIANLDSEVLKFGYKNIKWNVSKFDGLYYDEECKFDYVVGNPPYISYLDLDVQTRSETKKKFLSCNIGTPVEEQRLISLYKILYSYNLIDEINPLLLTPSIGEKLDNVLESIKRLTEE